MGELPVSWTRTRQSRLLCDLFQVMFGVGAVKLAPLFRAERAKDRMIQQFDAAAKAPLGIGEGSIHGDQRIVESTQGIVFQAVFRNGLFGGGTS
jgi:hypothetical protein